MEDEDEEDTAAAGADTFGTLIAIFSCCSKSSRAFFEEASSASTLVSLDRSAKVTASPAGEARAAAVGVEEAADGARVALAGVDTAAKDDSGDTAVEIVRAMGKNDHPMVQAHNHFCRHDVFLRNIWGAQGGDAPLLGIRVLVKEPHR